MRTLTSFDGGEYCAFLYKECLQDHGHKAGTRLTFGTCGAIDPIESSVIEFPKH